MKEITLVRHGQANSEAKDEESYDWLSDLGHQQAEWLGEYLRGHPGFDRIVSGTMRRQIQTAKGLNVSALPHDHDARLNELDYFGLSTALRDDHGVPFPETHESFAAHVPQVIDVWRAGRLRPVVESYEHFRSRIFAAASDAAEQSERPLLVTSTGVIATLTAMALGLDTTAKSKIFLSISHTSLHRFALRGGELHLMQFGATPHLDTPQRLASRTFI
ncbi:histidine phosphatase family protein [Poseidonocella sedimentorum]|uniref:Broad specificity phosphatase PhoE n=1 Tax=Poseidonocella sedimentorum TaxID=871652 RepID=A0A1I6E8K7_9RHOB|nr:histidine phosphatase family protein [Poseidonocella sedimentorum]SFR14064.1 Broad specificity phosphatase PhoE [Poseidonocella sedimentorum]